MVDVPLAEVKATAIPRTCVVLNGTGFLGRSLVSKLLNFDDLLVRIADSSPLPSYDPLLSSSSRVEYHRVDVRHVSQLKRGSY